MGFNFGAFAGGLADGIEKGEKIRAAAEERKRKEKEATTKAQKEARETQEAKDKVLREQDEKLKKAFSEANKNMTDYIVDGDIDAGIKYFNTESDTYNLGTKKAKLTSGGETYIVDVPSGQEETISAIQADLDKYNGNGHYKVDKLGNVLTRQYDTQEFQPSQIKGTNTALYGKPEAEKPTAHTTRVVSSLPEAQQKILEQKGYKPTDEVSNTVIAKLATEKPTKITEQDISIKAWEDAPDGKVAGVSFTSWKSQKKQEGIDTAVTERDVKFKTQIDNISGGVSLSEVVNPNKRKLIGSVFNKMFTTSKIPLMSNSDKTSLGTIEKAANEFDTLANDKGKAVTGFVDSWFSSVAEFTGMGSDVEFTSRFKAAFQSNIAQTARSMQGSGQLSNQDINMSRDVAGKLWKSDKAFAGQLLLNVENGIAKLISIRDNDTTNKDYFEFRYGAVLKQMTLVRDSLRGTKEKKWITQPSSEKKVIKRTRNKKTGIVTEYYSDGSKKEYTK